MPSPQEAHGEFSQDIAIVGMACRFPGSANINEFWQALRAGKEAITFFSEEELASAGVDIDLLNNPYYVRAKGVLADADLFDAEFFGFSPREAELTDPQQRVFLECAWTAMEDAAYDPDSYPGAIGVFAGAGWNSYLLFNIASHAGLLESDAGHQILLGNEKDNLTTRVSYKLNLRGPSVAIQTGCSTSLVAVSLACQSLLNYQCDMALSGGVSISIPQTGYLYRTGGIMSPDGHCRAFDARAQGTVVGSGAGVVVLKRLHDALADRDRIHAVIKATAINNDGRLKAGYTAPSIDGQAQCIVEAIALSGVPAESIGYLEAHGTGTSLGDPIEIEALTKAFRDSTFAKNFCALGSVKTNIGHADAAAGVAGLIKTALALKHGEIPASLHFERPNPQIDFANSPFYVNTALSPWQTNDAPRRAGVSSFGLGGTNAHAILEEAPYHESYKEAPSPQLLLLSANTRQSLESATTNLARHLREHPQVDLSDVAYTLQVGRKAFAYRRTLVCENTDETLRRLEERGPESAFSHVPNTGDRPVAFMFTGQGAQYVDMARALYDATPSFAETLDLCLDLLVAREKLDLRPILYPAGAGEEAAQKINRTEYAQPALFIIEYALARMWQSWGITMHAAIGHSIGEYVAATLAGVFTLEDALSLVTLRGRLMQGVPPGAMLAIPLSEEKAEPMLGPELDLAAVNEPSSCVVSGPADAIAVLQQTLTARNIAFHLLHTSHAFHSRMTDSILAPFQEQVEKIRMRPPRIPYVSNVTGTWITDTEATDPKYWVSHMRWPVRFSDGLRTLLLADDYVMLEIGPGRTLSNFAGKHPERGAEQVVLSSLPHPQDGPSDCKLVLNTLGKLWLSGVRVDWSEVSRHQRRRRVGLPGYAFDRRSYWLHPPDRNAPSKGTLPVPASEELWQVLIEAAGKEAKTAIARLVQTNEKERRECLDDLCVAYMNLTLRRLGCFHRPTDSYSPDSLMQSCGISSRHHQLCARMLSTLSEHGQLRDENGSLTGLVPCTENRVRQLARQANRIWRGDPHAVELVQTCGEALSEVLRGERNPLELFSSVLDSQTVSPRFRPSLETSYNAIIRSGLEQVLEHLPSSTQLRILEIGGGTGIATEALLPLLPAGCTSYLFTDVGQYFLSRAKQKFRAYPFVSYGILDVNLSPEEQGYENQGYDVIVAVKMLHVAQKIDATLDNVRSLLAPGGLFIIWEVTQPTPEFDVTYALLMDRIEDGRRSQGNPFYSSKEWSNSLAAHGFDRIAVFPDDHFYSQHLILARATMAGFPPDSTLTTATPAFGRTTADPGDVPAYQSPFLKNENIDDWFSIPSWKRTASAQLAKPSSTSADNWLIFVDSCRLGRKLVEHLEMQKKNIMIVQPGDGYHYDNQRTYTINPGNPGDYNSLVGDLCALDNLPDKVVHLWSVTPNQQSEATIDRFTHAGLAEFNSLLFLAQALGEWRVTQPLDIMVVSHHMQDVSGAEGIFPEKALLLGPCKVIPLEYPNVECRSVDVVLPDDGEFDHLVTQLLDEAAANASDGVVAYRGPYRWVQTIEPVRLAPTAQAPPRLKKNGVYLITGGLGKIGITVAEYLAGTVAAKLILTCRSPFPQPETPGHWHSSDTGDDKHGRIVRKLQELEAAGSEIMVVNADVADLDEMQAAIERAQDRFGPIDGVIHSAGVLGDGSIQQKTPGQVAEVLRPKVTGTIVLDAIFKDRPIDFLVLFSSLSALMPGFGQLAYSAANNFLDAFPRSDAARKHRFVTCLSWDVWQGEGMAYDAVAPAALRAQKDADFNQRGILHQEGVEVFNRVLGSSLSHVLVSTSDYLRSKEFNLPRMYLEAENRSVQPAAGHPRPRLATDYAPPDSETEKSLAQIWHELLGINGIGVDDDFLELGGDSLIGMQLITRIKKDIGIQLTINSVYLHRTIRGLSQAIEETLLSQSNPEILRAVVDQLKEIE